MRRFKAHRNDSIHDKLRNLSIFQIIPLCFVCLLVFGLFLLYSMQYAKVSNNITTVSQFNQNFKDEVDLKMYYFVIGSDTELPLTEVEDAKQLAAKLLASTRNHDSHNAIISVLNLCENLSDCITSIQLTRGYDQRITQLENNVYVITQLIQEYMYTYLYHEAGALAALRARMSIWMVVNIVVILGAMSIIIYLNIRRGLRISRSITQPIDRLYQRVQEIGRGDLSKKPPIEANDDKLQALSDALEEMVSQLDTQIELNRHEQIRLRSMEFSLLQAQINPHFLYNTLDALIWLVESGKNDEAVEMVSSLSTYFRSFLSNGREIITLHEELLHVQSYLEIQQVRYKDILHYEIDSNPTVGNCAIPKMTLQPLVENAIYHGIKPKRGRGAIQIRVTLDDGFVQLEVVDTGVGMPPEELDRLRAALQTDEATGFGMFAVYQRLKLNFGADFSFCIDSREQIGTRVELRIPYTTSSEAIL